jgi:hypothetical protein
VVAKEKVTVSRDNASNHQKETRKQRRMLRSQEDYLLIFQSILGAPVMYLTLHEAYRKSDMMSLALWSW